jgi:hypothetical protein
MYQITAAEFMPLPIMEMRLAVKISLIPRCCHISRMDTSTLAQSQLRKLLTYTECANYVVEVRRLLVNGRSENRHLVVGI